MRSRENNPARRGEEGFLLLAVIVMVFLVMLGLSIAAPTMARSLRREREVEAIHRGNEYVRAIQLYYRKFGRYPGTMDQLEKSTNIRFLRRKYEDPMTGKANWKLIHVGEAKTTVKGFFGQPLAGLPGAGGMGAGQSGATTMNSASPTGSPGLGTGGSLTSGSSSSGGFSLGGGTFNSGSNTGASGSNPSSPGGTATPGSTVDSSSSSSGSSSGMGSQSATTFNGGGAPIVGVGSSRTGTSITILNDQTTYETWEFLYDPRIEQLKAKAALLGGGTNTTFGGSGGSGSSSGSGSMFSPGSGSGSSSQPGNFGSSPTSPTSGFGSSSPNNQ